MPREAFERDEFRTPVSDPELRVMQIVADDNNRSSENVYMDCPSWSPDSKTFSFWRRGSDDHSKKAGFWLCQVDSLDIEPVLEYDEYAAKCGKVGNTDCFCGALLAPDGKSVYRIDAVKGKTIVTRICLHDKSTEVVCTAPTPFAVRGSVAMSCDSKHLVVGVFLGDGKIEGAPWGAYVFDVIDGKWWIVEFGNGFRNMHCQYSKNPEAPYDLMVNGTNGILSDGSWLTPPDGSWRWKNMPPKFPPGEGCFTWSHVLRDDGANWRMVPLGDGDKQMVAGHCGFLGQSDRIFCGMYDLRDGRWRAPIYETTPVAMDRDDPEYWRGQLARGVAPPIDLSRKLSRADSCHIACDLSGEHFVSDTDGYVEGKYSFLWIATRVARQNEDPYLISKYLLLTRSSYSGQPEHAHPVLSPDGKYVVFQSDCSGRGQVNIAMEFEYPKA